MAKKPKETNVPLIFALVFFILTTIAFGVMWYLSFSEMEEKNAAVKAAEDKLTAPRNQARDNELKARVYRLYMGIGDEEDKKTVDAEAKAGDVISTGLDRINAEVAKKLGQPDASGLPKELQVWATDSTKKANPAPAAGAVDRLAALKNLDVAYKAAEKERDAYKAQIKEMENAGKTLAKLQKEFQGQISTLPVKFQQDLAEVSKKFEERTQAYVAAEDAANKRITALSDEKDRLTADMRKLNEQLKELVKSNENLQQKANAGERDKFTFDEPQGKVLRKLPEGAVEINIGSAAGVRPGLTFSVLPPDFPEKGKQSRMRMLRVPDGKGGFTSVESFVPKGSLEVYEVVGPNLSLARIQPGTETDPIRDGVTVGDLIYNAAWRKGVADRVALIGIFDVNGDGIDDIQSVARDLIKVGIPVDAYFDMKKLAWVGEVTPRTRYIIEGYRPAPTSAHDPHVAAKSKMNQAIADAIEAGKKKGVGAIDFRDFFARMGYKFRLDVTEDKINQATAPYLSNVSGEPLTPPNP